MATTIGCTLRSGVLANVVLVPSILLALVATAIYLAIAARFSETIHRMLVDIEQSFTAGIDHIAGTDHHQEG